MKQISPTLGRGLSRAGHGTRCLPLIDLTNPSPQSIVNSKIKFNEWTIAIKFDDEGAPAGTEKLWNIQLNSDNSAFLHYLSNGNLQLTIESNNVIKSYVFAGPDYLLGKGDATIVVAAKTNDLVVAINGIIIFTCSNIPMPLGTPTGLGVGRNYAGTQPFNDAIRSFQFYTKRLSNETVKLLGRHKDFGVSATYDPDRLIHYKLGQSNSVGTQATAPSSSVYTNLARLQIITKNGALDTSYQDPSSSNGTTALFSNFQQNGVFSSGGIEADFIAGAHPGKTVAVMHIDRGSTGLVENTGNFRWLAWDTSVANQKTLRAPAYQATLMQIIGALHGKPHSRTWWQGENDAGDAGISQLQYRNALVDLLRVFDEYVRVPTVVVGLHDEPSAGRANWEAIQAAQAEINTYYGIAYHVSAAGASTVVDEVHLDQAGYIAIGEDIAAQINSVT